ncbi:MAG: RNA polymerase sigma factor [Prevotella sp.]|nr:RNA polymerase sigma factor [Prevotella sp.]
MEFVSDILPLKNKLYRLALRITRSPQEAEDIVQDTLVKIWRRRSSWGEIESAEAFALAICRNQALDFLKRKDRNDISLDDITGAPPLSNDDPFERLTRTDNLSRIEKIINALPEKQRTCMQLRDIEGLAYKEIASVLDITEEQVKVNIFRARKAVKEKFLKK